MSFSCFNTVNIDAISPILRFSLISVKKMSDRGRTYFHWLGTGQGLFSYFKISIARPRCSVNFVHSLRTRKAYIPNEIPFSLLFYSLVTQRVSILMTKHFNYNADERFAHVFVISCHFSSF